MPETPTTAESQPAQASQPAPADQPAPPAKPVPFHTRHKRALLITLAVCVVVAVVAALLFKTQALAVLHWTAQFLSDIVDAVRRAGPVPYFAAYAILPAFGVPISLFNLTVAPTFAPTLHLGWVIVLSALCMAFNLSFSYWLARYALRPLVEKLVKRLGYTLPVIPRDEHVTASVLLRVVPGAPYAVQSFILGLAKVRFPTYIVVSFIAQFGYALAMILLGKSFTQGGSFKIAIIAIVLIVVLVIVARLVGKYYTKKVALKKANAASAGSPQSNA